MTCKAARSPISQPRRHWVARASPQSSTLPKWRFSVWCVSKRAPVWDGEQFSPRLILPVFLSYDHRVIDGALAARFMRHMCDVLTDLRRLLL